MSNKLKIVLAFVAGAVSGSLGTFYIVREVFRQQAEEEIKAVRDIYMKRDADEMKDAREKEGIVEQTEEELAEYYLDRLKELGVGVMTEEEYQERELVNPVDDLEDEGPTEYADEPEEIDKSEFYNGWDQYDSVSLTLYSKDGVILDEVEDIVDNIDQYIGHYDIKQAVPGESLYFVNHAMMLKIEIEVVNQSYKRDVLGEIDENVEWGDKKPE